MRAGARGYVLKDSAKEEIVRAIQAAGNGEAIFSPAIANRLIAFFATPRPFVTQQIFPELTEREREILGMRFFQDMSQPEIAERVGVSQSYLSRVLRRTLDDLRRMAEEEGREIVPPPG